MLRPVSTLGCGGWEQREWRATALRRDHCKQVIVASHEPSKVCIKSCQPFEPLALTWQKSSGATNNRYHSDFQGSRLMTAQGVV